ncbi:MFS transporter [Peribacillus simplex]|uniref:MFS transporter n=1 Tax=Peribacillus simplex TaxID=1478 RepID=A0A8B5Y3X5_9BACI|nr:MFS transporter [Peribacillus simplex]TVX83842.1 MFS transporter [Peribacillus simplex]
MNAISSEKGTFLGLRKDLVLGLIGVLLFIVGDGLEHAWISPYLVDEGMSIQHTALLITIYGVAVTIGAWFSGVLAEAWGPRKTMLTGAAFWLIGQVLFLTIALPSMNLAIMIPTYAIRGLGYPLFCYSFLVWVTYTNPQKTLGTAVGWFYLAFTGGLYIVANYYASFMIPIIGHVGLLWSAMLWVVAGTTIVIIFVKGRMRESVDMKEQLKILLSGITIVKENPRVGLGGIVRMINSISQFGLPVFFPTYLASYGFSTEKWLSIWATAFIVNIAFNLIFGIVGDKIGWRKTIMWFGGIGCGIVMIIMAYAPVIFGDNFVAMLLVGCLYGAILAAFCPISALLPSLEPEKRGSTMSILNLGAGLAAFAGPGIVGLFIGSIGAVGVLWIFAFLYFTSSILMIWVKSPSENKAEKHETLIS